MQRTPLPPGFRLQMPNGGVYILQNPIAEGGFSLIYEAQTEGGAAPVVIKEFYPANGACRDAEAHVSPQPGYEAAFQRGLERFQAEGSGGGTIAGVSFQAISFQLCGAGYAVLQKNSADMRSLADLVAGWETQPPLPYTGNPADADPVFPDSVRVTYALRVVSSILSALTVIHAQGFLHLDLSSRNVIWAGAAQRTGQNCAAFLMDFGCMTPIAAAQKLPTSALSYSPGFAAPEAQQGGTLTPATDLYSVGMLLLLLCVGNAALRIPAAHYRVHRIQCALERVRLPPAQKTQLTTLLCQATEVDAAKRFATADAMQADIRALLAQFPAHPINPDATSSFTLYSLRAMLEGSRGSHYSWAHELRDRRGCQTVPIPEEICRPISDAILASDSQCLARILPEEIYHFLAQNLKQNPQYTVTDLMTGRIPQEWRAAIRQLLHRYGTHRLQTISRGLLDDAPAFQTAWNVLLQLLGEEGARLQECFYCSDAPKHRACALAMLIVFALLGAEEFAKLLPSPANDAPKLFSVQ